MIKEIWFDMDGTIADLYGVEGWLDDIKNERADAYKNARPLVNLQVLARLLNRLLRQGYEVGIVSWTARDSSEEYAEIVEEAKRQWLSKHLASVHFSHIDIIAYGTPKQIGRNGILFDDEEKNRTSWNGIAYDVDNILEILRGKYFVSESRK